MEKVLLKATKLLTKALAGVTMYTLNLKLANINYTETLHALYPHLAQRLETSRKHDLLLRLYHGMEGKSEAVAEKMLIFLPEAERICIPGRKTRRPPGRK